MIREDRVTERMVRIFVRAHHVCLCRDPLQSVFELCSAPIYNFHRRSRADEKERMWSTKLYLQETFGNKTNVLQLRGNKQELGKKWKVKHSILFFYLFSARVSCPHVSDARIQNGSSRFPTLSGHYLIV